MLILGCFALAARAGVPGPPQSAVSNGVRRLTLAEAYILTVAQNEELSIRSAEWSAAEARYRQAVGERWPEVRAEGSAAHSDVGEKSGAADVYRAGVGASVSIFDGFRMARKADARRAELGAADFDRAQVRQMLYQDVADVFYQALANVRESASLDEQIVTLQDRVTELERRVALGRSRRGELLTAQAQIAELRVDVEQMRGARRASLELLAFLTGLSAESLEPVDGDAMPAVEGVLRYLAKTGERPDVRAQGARVAAAQAETRATRAERGVGVTLDGNAYVLSDPGKAGDWDIALRAEIPLFDHGRRAAAVAEKEAQVRASELRLTQVGRTADRDVRVAYAEVRSALAQWAAIADALRVMNETVQILTRDYELGRASNLDVLSALIQRHNLRRRAGNLEMRAKAAFVHLHVAAGEAVP